MKFGFDTVLCILAVCIDAIAAAAYYLNFDGDQKITTGYAPRRGDRIDWVKEANIFFYINFSKFALGLICIVFGIIEILLIFIPEKLSFLDSCLVRGIVYAFSGIAVLGCSNDLGIAAGILQMIIALVMIVWGIVQLVRH